MTMTPAENALDNDEEDMLRAEREPELVEEEEEEEEEHDVIQIQVPTLPRVPDQKPKAAKKIDNPPEDRLVVAVRLRPHDDTKDIRRSVYALDDKTVIVREKDNMKTDVLRQKRISDRQYEFDLVLDEDATQEEVYEGTTKSLVEKVVRGGNATVLAYGATGAGKTYTMVGTADEPGVMVRALDDLFKEAAQLDNENSEMKEKNESESDVSSETPVTWRNQKKRPPVPARQVTMSYLEVYNEKIKDLLNPSSQQLELREDSSGGVRVAGLSEVFAQSTEEVLKLLQRGNKARSVEPTAANRTSSRSHAMLQVSVLGNGQPEGRLLMVDLAGSERASQTQNRGKRLQEGAHINLSLLALGNCITALARGGDVRHINFRDSKLTRLLKGALTGGGSKLSCVMIAHVAPGSVRREESRTTLLYAERAARISLAAAQNNRPAGYMAAQATIRAEKKRLRAEIEMMRARLDVERSNSDEVIVANNNPSARVHHMSHHPVMIRNQPKSAAMHHMQSDELADIKEQILASFRDQMRARRRLLEVDSQLLGLGMLSDRYNLTLRRWEAKHGQLYKAARMGRSGKKSHTDPEDSDYTTQLEEEAQQAWRELCRIEREQEHLNAVRADAQNDLEKSRQRANILEQELSKRVGSEWGERELLALICRVHELELERLEAHGAALAREHELRRRQSALRRHERQRQICDQIITQQRQLIEERSLALPDELEELYSEYLREVQTSSYNAREPEIDTPSTADRLNLPPILTAESFLSPAPSPVVQSHYTPRKPRMMRTYRGSKANKHEPEIYQISTPGSSGDSSRDSPLPPIHNSDMTFSLSQAMHFMSSSPRGQQHVSMSPLPPIKPPTSAKSHHTAFGHPPPAPAKPSRLPRPVPSRNGRSSRNRKNKLMPRSISDEDLRE
ncbi:kinesin-like protein KIF19 [Neocloeon triangulifer]|uniref:kinesin-like protein KIF19 n=1 Tax=Neocloeon triangulifer TaxID=2078957 RepID=UPI00286F1A54|nr:kinesin-like protein KIF19 [Neocloeon triangulifer]